MTPSNDSPDSNTADDPLDPTAGPSSVDRLVAAIEDDPGSAVETAAATVRSLADSDPDRADALLSALAHLFDHEAGPVRNAIALTAVDVAETHPERVATLATPLVDALRDDYPLVRKNAAEALVSVASVDPAAVATATDVLADALHADLPDLRRNVTAVAFILADEDPAAVVPLIDPLLDCVGREYDLATDVPGDRKTQLHVSETEQDDHRRHEAARRRAGLTIARLAEERPESVIPVCDRLCDLATSSITAQARLPLLETLGTLAESRPDDLRSVIDPLASVVDPTEPRQIVVHAVSTLGALAETHPTSVAGAVVPVLAPVIELFDASDPQQRGAAVGLAAYVAEHRPDALGNATPALRSLLADDHWFVRVNAAWALGFIGDDAAVRALREAEPAESNPDVEAAIEAALREAERC